MKIMFVSLGCDKNLVDTENMLGILRNRGFEFTDDEYEADVIAVNTCCFIHDAKQESIDTILEMAEHKKDGKCKALIVSGCLAHRYHDEIEKEIPEVDALLGTASYDKIAEVVLSVLEGKGYSCIDDADRLVMTKDERIITTGGYYEYLKIAEGCDKHCTYCIIPKVRGAFRSRTIESIKAEVERLAATGVKEVVLIAQDTTSYGIDLNAGKPLLTTLLKELTTVEGIEWIRMLYLYPTFFSDELLDIIVNEPKLCKYVDIPLQHVNNDILKQMNRRDDRNDIERLLKKIRNAPTHITLRTSIIVGFPGETDEQFEELCDFVKEIKFDNMGVFTYSQEDGTPAGAREDQIPEEVKEERYHVLMSIQAAISEENNRNLEGTIDYAMVEEIEEGENNTLLAKGRLKSQAPDVDGNMYIEDCGEDIQPGDILKVQVEQGFAYDVVATVVE